MGGYKCTCRDCKAAEYYEDSERWVLRGPGRKRNPQVTRRLDQVKTIRLSSEEMAFLRDKADAAGCSTSDLIREAIGKINPTTLFIDGRRVS